MSRGWRRGAAARGAHRLWPELRRRDAGLWYEFVRWCEKAGDSRSDGRTIRWLIRLRDLDLVPPRVGDGVFVEDEGPDAVRRLLRATTERKGLGSIIARGVRATRTIWTRGYRRRTRWRSTFEHVARVSGRGAAGSAAGRGDGRGGRRGRAGRRGGGRRLVGACDRLAGARTTRSGRTASPWPSAAGLGRPVGATSLSVPRRARASGGRARAERPVAAAATARGCRGAPLPGRRRRPGGPACPLTPRRRPCTTCVHACPLSSWRASSSPPVRRAAERPGSCSSPATCTSGASGPAPFVVATSPAGCGLELAPGVCRARRRVGRGTGRRCSSCGGRSRRLWVPRSSCSTWAGTGGASGARRFNPRTSWMARGFSILLSFIVLGAVVAAASPSCCRTWPDRAPSLWRALEVVAVVTTAWGPPSTPGSSCSR